MKNILRKFLRIHELVHELCDGRWVAVGGGGYDWINVVPRAWAHLTAISAGSPIPTDTAVPQDWRTLVKVTLGEETPAVMGDGVVLHPHLWSAGNDPLDRLDRAVLKTMDAVYPALGLQSDPYPLW